MDSSRETNLIEPKDWIVKKTTTLNSGVAIAVMSLALASSPAFAQDSITAETGTAAADEAIVVTGSRIRSPNLESVQPISVVTGEEFFETGQVSVGDVLNDLPQLRNTYSQQNSTRFLGTRGLNLLDLRGLGSERTLVLVNGRRHVAGDVLSSGVSPDVNTFPTDLIERVELVTGGNSAVYGSDAIAGVVNFVLKKDYEGIQLRGQTGVNIDHGDAGNQYVSLLAGKNFGDGRGNVALNLEYAHQSDYYASGRKNLAQNDTFIITDTDPSGSDGIFDRTFYRDVRSATIATGGMVAVRYANSAAPCGADALGAAFTCASIFNSTGALNPITGQRVGLGPNGNFIGGNGYIGREGRLVALSPELTRYSVNLLGHYEVSPAFVPFVEAKYVRTEAQGSQSGPFFSQGQTLSDAIEIDTLVDPSYYITGGARGLVNREGIRLDNPYLSAQARATLTQQLLATTVNPNTGSALNATQLAAQRAAIANGSFRFSLRRNWVDLGIRDEAIRRETYRAVFGVRGDFNDDWNYEVFANYGEHKERNLIKGNVNTQRYLLAVDTAVNPLNGQIVCRSQLDGRYAGEDVGGNPNVLAADVAACVPLNPFGDGSVSDAARKYLLVDSLATGKITQLNLGGYLAGDLSSLFELPGGPISFSIGAEYRRETLRYDLDDLTQAGYAFYNAIPSFSSPAFEVKEAFAEVRVPLLKDVPLFQELTLTGSARVADYKGAAGTVWAYSGGVEWRPIEDVRFRGTYAKSVRAPNLSELYSAQGQNFAPGFVDPCSERNIGTGSATRRANCDAAGRPAGYDYVYSSSLEVTSGGNPGLKAEKSTSWTVGGVFTPRFVPGLSLSVDYYDIKVDDVISAVSAQQIANLCYDSPDLNNVFCTLFERAGASGGPNGEQQFRIVETSLLQSSTNFASMRRRGIDTNFAYQHRFDWGRLNLNAIWTHTFQNDDFTNPSNPNFANRFLNELADPSDEVSFNAGLEFGKVTVGYKLRWIDKMYLNTWEDYNPLNGQGPQNADYAPIKKYPDVFYHDIRVGLDVNDQFNVYLGVDNITNRQPPYGLTGVGGGSGIYDVRGRYGYAGVVAKF